MLVAGMLVRRHASTLGLALHVKLQSTPSFVACSVSACAVVYVPPLLPLRPSPVHPALQGRGRPKKLDS